MIASGCPLIRIYLEDRFCSFYSTINHTGGSLSDSSDDNYPGFGGGAGTGLGFGSYAGVGSAQGFVAGPTTETTYPVSINNQQVAPQSYSSSDEVGDERPVLGK